MYAFWINLEQMVSSIATTITTGGRNHEYRYNKGRRYVMIFGAIHYESSCVKNDVYIYRELYLVFILIIILLLAIIVIQKLLINIRTTTMMI